MRPSTVAGPTTRGRRLVNGQIPTLANRLHISPSKIIRRANINWANHINPTIGLLTLAQRRANVGMPTATFNQPCRPCTNVGSTSCCWLSYIYHIQLNLKREKIVLSKVVLERHNLWPALWVLSTEEFWQSICLDILGLVGWFIVFSATFNNISGLSWRSVLLVGKTAVPEKPPTCHKSLTNFIT